MSAKKEYPRLKERKGIFYIYDYIEGELRRQSTGANSELEAIKLLNQYIENKESKTISNQNEVVLFDEVALMFIQDKERQCKPKTLKQYKFLLKSLLYFFSSKDINSLKRIDIKQFEDLERLNNVSDGLLRKKLVLLQSIFKYAIELELANNNPLANYSFRKQIKDYEIRERFFTSNECQLLLNAIRLLKNDNLERIVIFTLETGLRVGELTNILFTDVAFQDNIPMLRIRKDIAKSKRDRFIPLSKLAQEQILKQKQDFSNSAFIFTTNKGEPYKTAPKTALNTALKKAGLKELYVSFHTLRHTAGSLWLQGINIDGTQRPPVRIEIVSEVLGHRDISFTKNVYAKFDNNSIAVGFAPNEFLKIQ